MIIVSGKIVVRPGSRSKFLTLSTEAMVQARRTPGCRDFVVAADPLDEHRVNIYEEWDTRTALDTFRGEGPGQDLSALIESAQVSEHTVSSGKS